MANSTAIHSPRPERILPSDVRYALRYKGAHMGAEEIRMLALSGFENEATYLLLRSVVAMPLVQLAWMRRMVKTVRAVPCCTSHTNEETRYALQQLVLSLLDAIPVPVIGTKLAQISRQGFSHWDRLYAAAACAHSLGTKETFLIGHATFIGLASYMQQHTAQSKVLHTLIPQFVTSDEIKWCGYRIGETVEPLLKGFPRTAESRLIDDTRHTGACETKMRDLWTRGNNTLAPEFVYFVITSTETTCVG